MATGQDILDRDILPRVFSSLDTVFPEFGWRRAKDGWVATNGNFTRSRFEARPDRVVCRQERGFMIYGDKSYHWLEYLYGADFPRGADWWTVVEELAARVGISVPGPKTLPPRPRALAALAEALPKGGPEVEAYLKARGSDVPPEWLCYLESEPTDLLRKLGFSQGDIEASGIVRDSRLQGRIGCIWHDAHGRPASLWGRATDGEEPKYLVLAGGAPPFFGADVAFAAYRKSRPAHGVVVVEGMFDALTLRAHGLSETLAIGRAGLSEEAFLTLEIAGEATLLLDGDDAGQKGTMQAIQTWAETMSPVRLSVTRLFAHKDPDELVRAKGIDALKDVIGHRMPAASAYVASLLSGAESEAELLSAAHHAVPFLASVAVCHPLEAAMATEMLSRRGLSSSALKLLTRQLDEEGLLQVRESLQRRLSEVDGLLGEG